MIEYKLLRNKELAKESLDNYRFLLPRLRTYRVLADNHLNPNDYNYSWTITLLFILFGIINFINSTIAMFLIKPVFHKKLKGLVLKKPTWGFGDKGLKDDMLVDNINIFSKDMIYYFSKNTIKRNEIN
jgi:hypothetical protein|tara:strand:+ start:14580 stop:14963 length:384 start_codon:yes stop_codon:yes gene_type:complete